MAFRNDKRVLGCCSLYKRAVRAGRSSARSASSFRVETSNKWERLTHISQMTLLASDFSEGARNGINGQVCFGVVHKLDDERIRLLHASGDGGSISH